MESGQFELNVDEITVADLVDRVVAGLGPLFETKSQQVTVEIAGGDNTLLVDGARLTQVMSNLLSNASKYSGEGSGILVHASMDGDVLNVSIRDEGIGMSEADQARVFTRFFRADNDSTRTESGTGLGLYIAKSIVELHGGRLWFESAPGAGSTFHFSVPGSFKAGPIRKAA
jgi:signal transduction histidine kinase